jgi:hypothetical protein
VRRGLPDTSERVGVCVMPNVLVKARGRSAGTAGAPPTYPQAGTLDFERLPRRAGRWARRIGARSVRGQRGAAREPSHWPDRVAVHVSSGALGRKKTSEKHADKKLDLTAKKGHSLLAKDFASKLYSESNKKIPRTRPRHPASVHGQTTFSSPRLPTTKQPRK